MHDPFRRSLQGRRQAKDQGDPPPEGQLLPGQQVEGQLPALPQPEIGLRVQVVGDRRGLVLPFLPGGRRGCRQGVGRGAAQAEAVLRQAAELPVKARILPADPA